MRESELIDWICSHSRFDSSSVPVGPGDDCAVVMCGDEPLLVTTDQVLDGVHFSLPEHGPRAGGRKAMARGLSDIAAMAGESLAAVATVTCPKGFKREDAEELYLGLRQTGDEFDCPVVGGDVAVWDGPLGISLTAFGRPGGIEPVLRSGAQAGDAICVTGLFGGAWRSSRHLTFTPRLREARLLAIDFKLNAMIDVSDGLAIDLGRVCKASGARAELLAEAVPIHSDALKYSADDPLRAALTDGEDYELVFTLPADQAEKLLAAQPLEVKITRIGEIVEGSSIVLLHPDGRREQLSHQPGGWEYET